MLKVYRLLRNNTETGPYTLEELLQTGLRPLDLIWVEGRSTCWLHPSEVEALRPHLPASLAPAPAPPRQAPPKDRPEPEQRPATPHAPHIFVSMPVRQAAAQPKPAAQPSAAPIPPSIEERAALLRQNLMEQAAAVPHDAAATRYHRSLDEAEEAYTQWMYTKKAGRKKNRSMQLLVPGILVAVLVAGGIYAGKAYLSATGGDNSQEASLSAPAQNTAFTSLHTDQKPEQATGNTPVATADTVAPQMVTAATTAGTQPPAAGPAAATVVRSKPAKTASPGQQTPVVNPAPTDSAPAQPLVTAEPQPAPTEQAATPEPAVRKKKEGGLFSGLFRKRNKEAAGTHTPVDKTSAPEGAERNSRTRGDVAPPASLASQVELRPEVVRDRWMMGVVGQKLTLYNRSKEVVEQAEVEVSYYSEDNQLLEKKVMQFNRVAPRRGATRPVPNHRTADHVAYRLISASGAPSGSN